MLLLALAYAFFQGLVVGFTAGAVWQLHRRMLAQGVNVDMRRTCVYFLAFVAVVGHPVVALASSSLPKLALWVWCVLMSLPGIFAACAASVLADRYSASDSPPPANGTHSLSVQARRSTKATMSKPVSKAFLVDPHPPEGAAD